MRTSTSETIRISIFMAGDIGQAKQICATYCKKVGLCVTVTETEYIYNGGREIGFIVGLINYPKYPTQETDLMNNAVRLADELKNGLAQDSYTVQGPTETLWVSDR